MGTTYIGNHTACRFNIFHEFLYVSRVACAHFYNSYIVITVKTQQSLWYAYIIIEVALGMHDVIFCSQYRRNKFLGGSLSVCTSNAYDRNIEMSSVLSCNFLECIETVVNENNIVVSNHSIFLFIYDSIRTSLLQSCLGKLVAVE